MSNRFFDSNVLKATAFQTLEVAGFVAGILPSYYLLCKSSELEKNQAKYYANVIGVMGYGVFCSFATRFQSKSSRIAVAKIAEVGIFVGTAIEAEILLNYFKFSQQAVLFASQGIGMAFYSLTAFIKHKYMRNELNQRNTTGEAVKKTLGQFSEIACFVAGILLMNSLETPFYSAYLVGMGLFTMAAWIQSTLTYESIMQEAEQSYLVF